jgi:hypothetical protein
MERLRLHTYISSEEEAQLLRVRYNKDVQAGRTVIIELGQEACSRLNLAVSGLFKRVEAGKLPKPANFEKNGLTYFSALEMHPFDGCSYNLEVIITTDEKYREPVADYLISCVLSPESGMTSIIDDMLSLSYKYGKVSELDLNDIVHILDSTETVAN